MNVLRDRYLTGYKPASLRLSAQRDERRRQTHVDKKLLDILVCPVTKGPLIYDKDKQELISRAARLAYPIRDGIPVMLEEEARKISEEEYEKLKR